MYGRHVIRGGRDTQNGEANEYFTFLNMDTVSFYMVREISFMPVLGGKGEIVVTTVGKRCKDL